MAVDPMSTAIKAGDAALSSPPAMPQGRPPPLPPRGTSDDMPPPTYLEASEDQRKSMVEEQYHSNDPRSSSMLSLVPSESPRDGRRTLLLVYIHGFMGNETSFQSFPAHVHNLLSMTLAETHVVHTKIYPRYKSRRAIEFARDDFSDWLEPHEGPTTDVILLGHSMGGLLSAEVILLPPTLATPERPFQHRILGTISFDTPFLGMHPGIIGSGISSLFRPAPDVPGKPTTQDASSITNTSSGPSSLNETLMSTETPPASIEGPSNRLSPTTSTMSSLTNLPSDDPYYNPPFPNDVNMPQRSGWSSILHFVNKHSDGLTKATKEYFMSHIEFGGCMADFPGLKNRYTKLRRLEDVNDFVQPGPPTRRVRFINYYTASTGIPKKPKESPVKVSGGDSNKEGIETGVSNMVLEPPEDPAGSTTPRVSIDEFHDAQTAPQNVDGAQDASSVKAQMENLGETSGVHEEEFDGLPPMQHLDSMPIDDDREEPATRTAIGTPAGPADTVAAEPLKSQEAALPRIPDMPTEPPQFDGSSFSDKDERKLAEKDHKRLQKAYQQATKDRENAIKDRRKLAEKREKKARQEREKALKAEEKQRLKEEKEVDKRRATINPSPPGEAAKTEKSEKPKKDRKFCLLPGDISGKQDKCWVRVYMEGVDEVGAHCGLFFPGPQYESLVGDVGARVEAWVKEDATRRELYGGEHEL